MGAPMPPIVVVVLCKVLSVGEPDIDANAAFTHWRNLEWATQNGMMVCRRNEVQMYDPAPDMGNADPRPFTPMECQRSAVMIGSEWTAKHPNSKWAVWRVACPTPTIDLNTGEIIGWVLPDCGHRDTVICEQDTAI